VDTVISMTSEPSITASRRTCSTVSDSMQWAAHGRDRLNELGFGHMLSFVRGKSLTISSGCSGILTPELGVRSFAHACGFEVVALWAVEKNRACQTAIMNWAHGPPVVYDNYLDLLRPEVSRALQQIPPSEPWALTCYYSLGWG
jgi:hypothetical protein